MRVAVFDLDHTLLAADSDYLWGQFLCDEGLVDRAAYEAANRQFYADYAAGTLDVAAFYRFSLAPLARRPMAEWLPLRARYVERCIVPVIAPGAPALIARHADAGDALVICTATQRFITEPIAALLGVPHLLASEPELRNGEFTGGLVRANFQAAKVDAVRDWMQTHGLAGRPVAAYSDSRNDLPLLDFANEAIAVDPDPVLAAAAASRGWPIISLR
jgi:HAD superfamily hydrolase (TIGR01490 family)